MISKSLTYLCFMVFFCSYACLALSEIDSKPKYILKCFEDKQDCTILETIPESSEEYTGNEGIAKRSQLASNDPSSRANLQKLIKRIFPSADVDANQSSRIYKTEHVNCLTGDCSLLTARITKRRNNLGTLACIGDPYSSSGSRCLPIEGLYIG